MIAILGTISASPPRHHVSLIPARQVVNKTARRDALGTGGSPGPADGIPPVLKASWGENTPPSASVSFIRGNLAPKRLSCGHACQGMLSRAGEGSSPGVF